MIFHYCFRASFLLVFLQQCSSFETCTDLLLPSEIIPQVQQEGDVTRSDFPHGFLFGTATSAYQIEGAYLEDGKSINNWDFFCSKRGTIKDGENGYIADDHYHRYLEDIDLIHSLGLNAYRFSISWSRVLPRGRNGKINLKGIEFYNKIIDNLLLKAIEPFVTIHHHDHPQELEDRFGGWLSPKMQQEFVYFSKVCFRRFGDRVKYWATINEPNIFSELAYMRGWYPPAHCSPPFGNCSSGNSDTEPLIVVHNMLLAHARVVRLYRKHFQRRQSGTIGIILSMLMFEPYSDNVHDQEAAKRALAFNSGWILDPLVFGDFPSEMIRYHGSELPKFTEEEKKYLKNSLDFIGMNHYGSLYDKDCIHSSCLCNHSSCTEGIDRAIRGCLNNRRTRRSLNWRTNGNDTILCCSKRHGAYRQLG